MVSNDRDLGYNTVSTLANLPVDKRLVIATLSGSTNLTLSGSLKDGEELHIIINASSSFTQPLPSSSMTCDQDSMSLSSGNGAGEINILYANSRYYVSSKAN